MSDRVETARDTFVVGHRNMSREFWWRLNESLVHVSFRLSSVFISDWIVPIESFS